MVEHDSWQMQVYAVLGLANLSDDGNVTPWLITQLDPLARNEILAISIDERSSDPIDADTHRMGGARGPNRLAAPLAYLKSLGEPLEASDIETMLDSSNEKVIAAALLILTWLGEEEAVDRINGIIAELPESRQFDILMTLVMFIERYQIEEAASWLDVLVTSSRMDGRFPELIQPGTATLLTIEPTAGIRHWKEWVGPSPKRRDQITAALMLLQVGAQPDPTQIGQLDDKDELVRTILNAADAVERKQGVPAETHRAVRPEPPTLHRDHPRRHQDAARRAAEGRTESFPRSIVRRFGKPDEPDARDRGDRTTTARPRFTASTTSGSRGRPRCRSPCSSEYSSTGIPKRSRASGRSSRSDSPFRIHSPC